MTVQILTGDCRAMLATLDPESVQTCVTSPPYFGLRDYGHAGQIGLEATPDAFVAELVAVFAAVRRVLKDDGTLWLNLGDSYAGVGAQWGGTKSLQAGHAGAMHRGGYRNAAEMGVKPKDLYGIPWTVALALRADGWYLRSDIIWSKPNPMPESITDRPSKSHEYLFLLSKSERYYYDAPAIAEDAAPESAARYAYTFGSGDKAATSRDTTDAGINRRTVPMGERAFSGKRNKRTVWTVPTSPYSGAHFATFPPALIEPCILAGSKRGDTVLDPFGGAGTTGLVADRLGRNAILCELNPAYAEMARRRITDDAPLFVDGAA